MEQIKYALPTRTTKQSSDGRYIAKFYNITPDYYTETSKEVEMSLSSGNQNERKHYPESSLNQKPESSSSLFQIKNVNSSRKQPQTYLNTFDSDPKYPYDSNSLVLNKINTKSLHSKYNDEKNVTANVYEDYYYDYYEDDDAGIWKNDLQSNNVSHLEQNFKMRIKRNSKFSESELSTDESTLRNLKTTNLVRYL